MPTPSTQHTNQTVALAARLETSDSATVYVDIDGMTQAGADELLLAEPALHAEFDEVRQQWAIRYATDDEVAQAQAAADESAPKSAAKQPTPASSAT
jgi:hypothetical protein